MNELKVSKNTNCGCSALNKRRMLHKIILAGSALFFTLTFGLWNEHEAVASVKKISLKKNMELYVGQKRAIRGNTSSLTYQSSKQAIFKVSSKGVLLAKKPGTAKLYVKKAGKKISTCKVRVGNYVKKLRLNTAQTVILNPGQTSKIKVTVLPKQVLNERVSYTSQNKKIAKVTAKGKITALTPGITKIQIKTKGLTKSGKKRSLEITVAVQESGSASTSTTPDLSAIVPITGNISGSTTETPSEGESKDTNTPLFPSEVPDAQAVASVFLGKDSEGKTYTVYMLNKKCQEKITIYFNGKQWSANRNVSSTLEFLTTTLAFGYTSTDKTAKVSKKRANDYWDFIDVTNNLTYRARVFETDTVYGSNYGLIVVEGDTSSLFHFGNR